LYSDQGYSAISTGNRIMMANNVEEVNSKYRYSLSRNSFFKEQIYSIEKEAAKNYLV